MFSQRIFSSFIRPTFASIVAFAICAPAQSQTPAAASAAAPSEARCFKGNLHTHSLWSDGDDYPQMLSDWYKREGYHFLGVSHHNVMQLGQRWFELKPPVSLAGSVNERGGGPVLEKYLKRFGSDWVELREEAGKR